MGNPTFLNSSVHPYRYTLASIPASGSTSLTTAVRNELTALGGWTEPTTKTFLSPANAAGIRLACVVTDSTPTVWRMDTYNYYSPSSSIYVSSRAITLSGGSSQNVDIYTGISYIFVENEIGGGWIYGFLLDTFPDDPSFLSWPVVGHGSLANNGVYDGLGIFEYMFAADGGSSNGANRLKVLINVAGSTYSPRMASGRYLYEPAWVYINIGGTNYWVGKLPQVLVGPGAAAAYSDWVIPINYSTSATFRATGAVTSGSLFRPFIRKA